MKIFTFPTRPVIAMLASVLAVGCTPPEGTPHTGAPPPQAQRVELNAQWTPDTSYIEAFIQQAVTDQRIAGAVVIVRQHDKEILFANVGDADREAGRPMARDTLFQVYSMSKPFTGVALMTLYEQGKFSLDDPLSKYLPEFEQMSVYQGRDQNGEPVLVPQDSPITIRQLVSHSAGFSYQADSDDYISDLIREDSPLAYDKTLAELSERVAELPLYYQPGRQWRYSIAVDVQARLVEVLSNQSFHAYLQDHVLTPLGLSDAHRFLNEEQSARLARGYAATPDGQLALIGPEERFYAYNTQGPHALEVGGYGLVMTADNYARFAQMLVNGGELDGVRILKPETVKLMASDLLSWPLDGTGFLLEKGHLGFGVDFAVRTAPATTPGENAGAVGEFFWDGYASTLFWVDPQNDLTAVMLVQKLPFDSALHHDFREAVYHGSTFVAPAR